jgi:type II secretory pathway pseudopilin PulG
LTLLNYPNFSGVVVVIIIVLIVAGTIFLVRRRRRLHKKQDQLKTAILAVEEGKKPDNAAKENQSKSVMPAEEATNTKGENEEKPEDSNKDPVDSEFHPRKSD